MLFARKASMLSAEARSVIDSKRTAHTDKKSYAVSVSTLPHHMLSTALLKQSISFARSQGATCSS